MEEAPDVAKEEDAAEAAVNPKGRFLPPFFLEPEKEAMHDKALF